MNPTPSSASSSSAKPASDTVASTPEGGLAPEDLSQSVAGEEDPGASIDMARAAAASPGRPDQPAAGETFCPTCGGSGKLAAGTCPECEGTGKQEPQRLARSVT